MITAHFMLILCVISACPATDSICKLEGNRLCICPSQYVCEPVYDSNVHRCELLAFFNRG